MTPFTFTPQTADAGAPLDLRARFRLELPADAGFALKERAREIATGISLKWPRPIVTAAFVPASRAHERLARLLRTPELPPQAYELALDENGALLKASDDAGFFYALLSLQEVLAPSSNRSARVLRASFAPALPVRGYMLDISRDKVPAMETLFALVDTLASLRYNQLQLYTEHTFAFADDAPAWRGYSPMTPEEIMRLDEYCARRFIELVPNLNSFGHLGKWLCHPEYAHLAEHEKPWLYEPWGSWMHDVICPGPEAEAFIARLYDEMLPNFTSRTLNVGCDETLELGSGRSRERFPGVPASTLYLDFLKTIARLARERGFRIQFWGDIILKHPDLIPQLPPDCTALAWGYEANDISADACQAFQNAGVPYLVCPGTSTWNSFAGRRDVMLANLRTSVANAIRYGAQGLLLTDWGDHGHSQYWPASWPGLTAAALAAWNGALPAEDDLARLVDRFFHTSGAGARILALGGIADALQPRIHNRAHPFQAFLDHGKRARDLGITAEACAALRDDLDHLPPVDDAPRLVRDELAQTAEWIRAGLDLIAGTPADWEARADALLAEHRRLWLARNREGGLHHSCALLRADLTPKA